MDAESKAAISVVVCFHFNLSNADFIIIQHGDISAAYKKLSDALSSANYKNSIGDPLQVSPSGSGYRLSDRYGNSAQVSRTEADELMTSIGILRVKDML